MKKNFISYIFIIFLFTSFSIFAEREVDYDKIEYNENTQLIHYDNEKEPFTGIAKEYYEDKTLKSEYLYKNGKLEGRAKQYYPSGKLESEANFVDGILEGKAMVYYESGKLKIEVNYKNAKPDGLAIAYHENGRLRIEENYKDGNLISKAVYKNGELVGDTVKGGLGSVVAGDVPDTDTENFTQANKNIENKLKYYTTISAICTVIGGLIIYAIFKILKGFPKTSHLTDEQRNRIFKILMKYDENKKELFSAYRINGVGTGYYRIRSMMVDNEKVYIYAKMFSVIYIPTPITFGYLLCYNKDKILASFSNATFKEAKKEIQETVLYL
ncbi:toxin-antitoxin system YwqK family antitoxin [Fusobacterium simiae]|uniref:toxin-antitoxin system YwqK family antitoxin n=1 Tax=Fusobacterium TaxID=848 RepID=UPI0018978D64|nr:MULTISPECIES: toxin-antitoxin system YwqK family antitoxin [Fusobacterium]MDC7954867.1 toxin-antitoxin system YwqK family antitoxin [Fusobacterium simiae]